MKKLCFFLVLLFALPAQAEIIWRGDYETGNFRQWAALNGDPAYFLIPLYGRPARRADQGDSSRSEYYGDGTLLTLVTDNVALEIPDIVESGPVRQGNYSAKFTVKSLLGGGTEVDNKDCDPAGNVCTRRRTEFLNGLNTDYLTYLDERWISVSHYIPLDWDDAGSGWAIVVFQLKTLNALASPTISISISGGAWIIEHRFSTDDTPWPVSGDSTATWQQTCIYGRGSPYDDDDDRDLIADFPNEIVSRAALNDLNKGGWTDWIIHVKFDADHLGTGFLEVWKRAGTDAWVHVLDIEPRVITRRSVDYEMGIGYYTEGYTPQIGMYGDKNQFWSLDDNRVIYNDNLKIGTAASTFDEMRPEGAEPPVPLSRVPGVRLSGGIGWR